MGIRMIENLLPAQAVRFLQQQCARLAVPNQVPRPWHYAELHNPWARAAALYDSWGFLALCESPALLDAIATQIGEDIILFDSEWLPARWPPPVPEGALESDAHRFPVAPSRGVTALIAFADPPEAMIHLAAHSTPTTQADRLPHESFKLRCASVLLVDAQIPYRVQSCRADGLPPIFVARFFPSSSRYVRDPTAPVHRALTDRYPLFNYARMPLWLVRGEDRAQNDFVTGFNARAGYWTSAGT